MRPFIIFLFIIGHPQAFSQIGVNEYFGLSPKNLFDNTGMILDSLTTLNSSKLQNFRTNNFSTKSNSNSFKVRTGFGTRIFNQSLGLYGYGNFYFKKYFYAYFFINNQTNEDVIERYSKYSFYPSQNNISGFGFKNDWAILQFSTGNENWGSGNNIQLALTDDSPTYEYFMLASDYGNLKVKYIHGLLESTKEDVNRYIVARGLEWTNRKSLIIGLSETIIYSGEGRGIEIAYINPIGSHLEVELNNRLTEQEGGDANAVWQISTEWLFEKNIRISSNILYDEFVLDRDIDIDQKNRTAYSFGILVSLSDTHKSNLKIYTSMISIGTPTFRHARGFNNFVQKSKPLGWKYGSDGREINFGLNYIKKKNFISWLELGVRELGEESILFKPYDDYDDYPRKSFPSGNIDKSLFLASELQWLLKPNFYITNNIYLEKTDGRKELEISFFLGFNLFFNKNFIL